MSSSTKRTALLAAACFAAGWVSCNTAVIEWRYDHVYWPVARRFFKRETLKEKIMMRAVTAVN